LSDSLFVLADSSQAVAFAGALAGFTLAQPTGS
jgi:hypothetical protein